METIDRARARIYAAPISAPAKLVALYLLDCRGGCPAMPEIAAACSLCERTARRCCRQLERAGLLLTQRNPGAINDYQVIWGLA